MNQPRSGNDRIFRVSSPFVVIFTVALCKPLWNWLSPSQKLQEQHLFTLALYISLVAPFGGFLGSTVKRTFGDKDFGSLLPGQGGLVDRLDCQLLTAPLVYLYWQFLGGVPLVLVPTENGNSHDFHVHTSL